MKKIYLFILISITTFSCKNTDQVVDNLLFNNILSNSDKLTIKLYDSTNVKQQSRYVEKTFEPKKIFNVINKKHIESFCKIFENAEQTEYCCCPISNYSISFLNNNKELDLFYVDTIEYKEKIRIYEGSYQYSYIVDKAKWKNFLDSIEE